MKRYIIVWEDSEGNISTDYSIGESALDAVEYLDIKPDQVVEVAQVLKNWKKGLVKK